MAAQHTPGPWTVRFYDPSRPGVFEVQEVSNQVAEHSLAAWEAERAEKYETEKAILEQCDQVLESTRRLIACAPELLDAAKCALADLEGIMPEFEPSGDREHPGWTTIEELKAVIKKATT